MEWRGLAGPMALFFVTLLSRVPFAFHHALIGKDGWAYLQALDPSAEFRVPAPGNIGFVLLARLAEAVVGDGVVAYEILSIGASSVGVAGFWCVCRRLFTFGTSFLLCLLLSLNAVVWFHGTPITSYPCWIAMMPWLSWAALKVSRREGACSLVLLTGVYGLGILLRPDIALFGAGVWCWALARGRHSARAWAACSLGVVGFGLLTLLLTVQEVGSLERALGGIGARVGYIGEFGWSSQDWIEGVPRNFAKLGLFLAWGCQVALIPAAVGAIRAAGAAREIAVQLAAVWFLPGAAFCLTTFVGTAGFVLLLAPPLYLLAGLCVARSPRPRAWQALLIAAAVTSTWQFLGIGIREHKSTRDVVVNVTLLRYTGDGVANCYNYNLNEFGVGPSWVEAFEHVVRPVPVPTFPVARCY